MKDHRHEKLAQGPKLSVGTIANDKIFENINTRMDSFTSAIKTKHSFNKMIKSQLSKLAASVPIAEQGMNLGTPEELETMNLVDIYNVW